MLRKSSLGIHLLNGSQSPILEDGSSDLPCIVREAKQSPSSKRVKLGQEKLCANFKDDFVLQQANGESKSHSWISEVFLNICSILLFLACSDTISWMT